MTAWTKITPNTGRGGRNKRTSPAVRRVGNGAQLVLPSGYTTAKRADIFSDGNGKLGIMFTDEGGYRVGAPNKSSSARIISIPQGYADQIPEGTTDCKLAKDGVITVLDLSQFNEASAH